ncbi:MAG: hypothetical protein ABL958_05010 [Bdellovibrionia bacterium]
MFDHIVQAKGVALYVLTSQQLERTIGSFTAIGSMGRDLAQAVREPGGTIRATRSFSYESPLLTLAAEIAMRSQLAKLLGFSWPLKITDEHFEFTAQLIETLKQEYTASFPGGRFAVVFYPGASANSLGLIPWFERKGIHYLNYEKLPLRRITDKPVSVDYDGNPTAEAYRIVAAQLARDLKNWTKVEPAGQ